MSAKNEFEAIGSGEIGLNFSELEDRILHRFGEAVISNYTSDEFLYFTLGSGKDEREELAIFCIADSIEPLRRRNTEKLRIGVPIREPDAVMPVPILGKEPVTRYFYLTYVAPRRGGIKTLRMTPDVYAKRFTGGRRDPVMGLAGKLAVGSGFDVIPMRKRPSDDERLDGVVGTRL